MAADGGMRNPPVATAAASHHAWACRRPAKIAPRDSAPLDPSTPRRAMRIIDLLLVDPARILRARGGRYQRGRDMHERLASTPIAATHNTECKRTPTLSRGSVQPRRRHFLSAPN